MFSLSLKKKHMNKVIKFLLVGMTFCFFSLYTSAQFKLPKVLAFGNFTYANPNGDFKNLYNHGAGFEIGGGLGFGKTLITASTGSIKYSAVSTNALGDLQVTPIKVGIRQYLLLGLFVNGNAGMAIQSYQNNSSTASNFIYEVGAGMKFLGLIEVGVAYTGWQTPYSTNANALLLKAGVAIKL